jgi:hypothetical protein
MQVHGLDKIIGFSLNAWQKVEINGKNYRVGYAGVNAVRLAAFALRLMHAKRPLNAELRRRIRELRLKECKAGLHCLILRTSDAELKSIAIWLRGFCGGKMGSKLIQMQATHQDERVRYAAAKTMRRLEAWTTLATMAAEDNSDRIRRIAHARPAREFRSRLSTYSEHVHVVPRSNASRSLFWSTKINTNASVPAKSTEKIREVLLRIREILRGALSPPNK